MMEQLVSSCYSHYVMEKQLVYEQDHPHDLFVIFLHERRSNCCHLAVSSCPLQMKLL
jgi:hypothetical protein